MLVYNIHPVQHDLETHLSSVLYPYSAETLVFTCIFVRGSELTEKVILMIPAELPRSETHSFLIRGIQIYIGQLMSVRRDVKLH